MNTLLNSNNHLFELARSGQRLPHIILAVVMGFVFVLAAQLGGGSLGVIIVVALSALGGEAISLSDRDSLIRAVLPDTALEQTIFLILAFGPIFLILWGWLAWFEKRPLWSLGMERRGAWRKYLRGFVIGLLMFVTSIGISAALGYIAFEEGDPGQQGLMALGGVLLVFVGWMVQGAAEEVVTRGWLLPTIGARYRPLYGVVISAVIFAIFHLFNPGLGPIAILNLSLFGLFTALYALYEGGLWGVFSIHTVWNWVQGNIFGFEVSGGPAAGGTLFNLREVGPDVITGGPFGPEGGLAVTIVLILSCTIVWIVGRRSKAP